jgi:type III secretory pathway lipoprotein EscJ
MERAFVKTNNMNSKEARNENKPHLATVPLLKQAGANNEQTRNQLKRFVDDFRRQQI